MRRRSEPAHVLDPPDDPGGVPHPRDRAGAGPDPGGRVALGAASRFEFGQWPEPPDENEPVIRNLGNVDRKIVVQRVESHREFSRETVDVGDGVSLEVEGIDSVTFYLHPDNEAPK